MNEPVFPDLKIAKNKVLLWVIAFIMTASSAIYQRMTGPSYPHRDSIKIEGKKYSFKLIRTEETGNNLPISIKIPDSSIAGFIQYRRYKSDDQWTYVALKRDNNLLVAFLPTQPPAGKIMYYVFLEIGGDKISLTGNESVIARYKGVVPHFILLPHILMMFLAMLFSTYTALEAFDRQGKTYKYMLWTMGFFLIGGFIFGPLVQKYAFGELWTGVPFGYDLTDNKTLIAMLGWIFAWTKNRRSKEGRGWIVFAGVLMLAVYLIPHSILGSELDYTKTQ